MYKQRFLLTGLLTLTGLLMTGCHLNAATPKPSSSHTQEQILTIKGTITSIEPGKDGYMARLKTGQGQEYLATFSRINLSHIATFKAHEVGDAVTITGPSLKLGDDTLIVVKDY